MRPLACGKPSRYAVHFGKCVVTVLPFPYKLLVVSCGEPPHFVSFLIKHPLYLSDHKPENKASLPKRRRFFSSSFEQGAAEGLARNLVDGDHTDQSSVVLFATLIILKGLLGTLLPITAIIPQSLLAEPMPQTIPKTLMNENAYEDRQKVVVITKHYQRASSTSKHSYGSYHDYFSDDCANKDVLECTLTYPNCVLNYWVRKAPGACEIWITKS